MSNKTRIYLAKSGQCDPDAAIRIASAFSKLDAEIVEWSGGTYSHDPMLSCDYLIVIPPAHFNEENSTVGKGQYEQLKEWQRMKSTSNIYIVNKYLEVSLYQSIKEVIINQNWSHAFGTVQCMKSSLTLESYIEVLKPKMKGYVEEPISFDYELVRSTKSTLSGVQTNSPTYGSGIKTEVVTLGTIEQLKDYFTKDNFRKISPIKKPIPTGTGIDTQLLRGSFFDSDWLNLPIQNASKSDDKRLLVVALNMGLI